MGEKESDQKFTGTILVYSVLGCPFCMKAKNSLRLLGLQYEDIRLDLFPHIRDKVFERSGIRTVPQIYFNNVLIGGNDALQVLVADKKRLAELVDMVKKTPMPSDGPIIPDPSTAVAESDSLMVECEQDEYFVLVEEMRKENIVKSDRNGSYFMGGDFVHWIMTKNSIDEPHACEIGQELLNRNFAKSSVAPPGTFVNGKVKIQFVDSGDKEALNSGPISMCVKKSANEVAGMMRKIIAKLYAVYLSPDGKHVDYAGIRSSDEFAAYKQLSHELVRVDIAQASREEKLAFFINIYNALVIHANVEHGPPSGLWQRYKFFNNSKYIISSLPYSLQDIENGVLRANRKGVGQLFVPFGKKDARRDVALARHEPLVHFALVCGAKSCPPIKVYSVENIYEELNLAAQAFLESEEAVSIPDGDNKLVKLSSIFKWYSQDFGDNHKETVSYIASVMAPGEKLDRLKEVIAAGKFKVAFLKYDWSVNSK